jgi:hypothetical protein
VGEVFKDKVCTKLAIEAGEDVAVEGRGDAGGIVIGGEQCGDGLGIFRGFAGSEINAEQKSILRREEPMYSASTLWPGRRVMWKGSVM